MQLIENKLFFNSIYDIHLEIDTVEMLDYINDLKDRNFFKRRKESNGFQTDNFDKLEQSEFFKLFEKISEITDIISRTWGIEKKLRLINFWFNLDKKYDYSISHYHTEGIISGIFYLKTPENTSRIVFERPDLQEHYFEGDVVNEYNYKNYSYDAVEKRLLLFPSYLKHRVEQNLTEDEDDSRISMSFNYGL